MLLLVNGFDSIVLFSSALCSLGLSTMWCCRFDDRLVFFVGLSSVLLVKQRSGCIVEPALLAVWLCLLDFVFL